MLKDERRDAAKDYLFEAILSLETIEDCYNFFEDLCTIKELEEMAKRMCGAKMLDTCKVYTKNQSGRSCINKSICIIFPTILDIFTELLYNYA